MGLNGDKVLNKSRANSRNTDNTARGLAWPTVGYKCH